jgi:hypothetical protein
MRHPAYNYNLHHDRYMCVKKLVTHAADIDKHIVDQRFKWYFLMLERDLQKESCVCSKIVLMNRSNKARSSMLK